MHATVCHNALSCALRFEAPYEVVGYFLSQEGFPDLWAADVREVMAGRVSPGYIHGNLNRLYIMAEWVLVSNDLEDCTPAIVASESFLRILDCWKAVFKAFKAGQITSLAQEFDFPMDSSKLPTTVERAFVQFRRARGDSLLARNN